MLGLFDLSGPAFLTLYILLLILAAIAGVAIPRWLRREGRNAFVTDPGELALLAGGRSRFAEAVTTKMLTSEKIVFDDADKFAFAAIDCGSNDAERSVLALGEPSCWPAIQHVLTYEAPPIEDRLVGRGLLIDEAVGRQMRLWQTLPLLLLLAFGTIKLWIGIIRDKPVGFLFLLLIVTAVGAGVRYAFLDRRTRSAHRLVVATRAKSERIRLAPTDEEAALGVALFGTEILDGSNWEDFHRMRWASTNDGGSGFGSGCGSSDGGGGCGGGCGGCDS